jgi:hypothetical protein
VRRWPVQFSIRIVDEDGEPRSGVKVTIHWAWTWSAEYTDDDGWAEFDVDGSPATGTVYAGGDELGEIAAEDGETFSFTLA